MGLAAADWEAAGLVGGMVEDSAEVDSALVDWAKGGSAAAGLEAAGSVEGLVEGSMEADWVEADWAVAD